MLGPFCAQLCYCSAGHVPVSGAVLGHGKKNKWLGLNGKFFLKCEFIYVCPAGRPG